MSKKISTSVFDGVLRCFSDLIIPDSIFDFSLEKLCKELKEESVRKNLTLSGAESVTGGMVASLLTGVEGASDYFLGSAVTYSLESKINILCLDADIVNYKGVVSEWTAREMALAARKLYRSSIGYGVTGYAGPPRGGEEKEVGTVCFGFSIPFKNFTWTQKFSGERNEVREQASTFVILGCYLIALNYEAIEKMRVSA